MFSFFVNCLPGNPSESKNVSPEAEIPVFRKTKLMDFGELLVIFGPVVAGAVFCTRWWFWVDAVVCSSVQVPFVHYLPGIFASLAALMFNCVRKDDLSICMTEMFVHRDIKCANILVHADGSVKLADFGLSKTTKLNDVKSCKGS